MINGIISILIVLIVVIICGELRKWYIKRKLRHFESPNGQWPIIGVAGRLFGKSNEDLITQVFKIYDEVSSTPFQSWFGPILVIGISEPEDIQTILTDDNCLDKPYFYHKMHCSSSIINIDRELWRPQRRALNTSFNAKMLQQYVPLLNDKSRILVRQMESFLKEPGDLYRSIFICMIDMITRTTMGMEMNLQSERGAFLYGIVKQIMNNLQYRISHYWLRWDFIYNLTEIRREEIYPLQDGNNFIGELYEKRINQLEFLMAQGIDYLEEVKEKNATNLLEKCIIMEKDGVLSHENVLDQMRVIILAGIDTSSISIFGTLLMLAINQKHQEVVLEELRSIFATADCDVTQSHLTNMPYTERVIKESMRLLSPVPFIARKPCADIELRKGCVPRGSMVLINIMHLHRNPKIWGDNVMEFDPDRFLPENIAKRPPFSYIPFSGGSRNCIGLKYAMISAKIVLSYLLRQFKFTTNLKFEDIRVKTHLVLEVMNDRALQIEKRSF